MKLRFLVLLLVALFLVPLAFGQGSTVGTGPVITTPAGQPIPFASVALCTTDPGPLPSAVCGSLATTYTSSTLATQCSGIATNPPTLPLNNRANPSSGTGCSNPGLADAYGNVIAFVQPGQYWCEFYGANLAGYSAQPCNAGALSSGGGSGSLLPIQKASTQAGSTADVQISNAISALGGSGIVLADYSSAQTWASCPTWGSSNVTVVLYPVTYTSSAASCVVPTNITLSFWAGALLSPATSSTIQIKGNINAGQQQLFTNALASQGTIDFTGNYVVQIVYPEWWGASPTASGSTNGPAIQAAIVGAYGSNRSNGSGLNGYNKQLHFSGVYNIATTLNFNFVNGFNVTCEERFAAGINQQAVNTSILTTTAGGTYGVFDQCLWESSANQDINHPLMDLNYTGVPSSDLATSYITFRDNVWFGNLQTATGIRFAAAGGGAQGSNIHFISGLWSQFTEAGAMIGAGSGCTPTTLAANAIAFTFDNGDFLENRAYGLEWFGGGQIILHGTTFEAGLFTTGQTGYDVCGQAGSAGEGFIADGVRSESPFHWGGNGPYTLRNFIATDQAQVLHPGPGWTTNQLIQGSQVCGGGVYYKVTGGGTALGLGSVSIPRSANSGSGTTLVDSVGGLSVNAWSSWCLSIIAGTGANCYGIVTSNSATTFTFAAGLTTNFPDTISCSAPDNTSTYIIEPVWGSQFNSGPVTWTGLSTTTQIDSGLANLYNVFIPGLQLEFQTAHPIIEQLDVTRADWLASNTFIDNTVVWPHGVIVAGPAASPGSGVGNINGSGLYYRWTNSRNSLTEIPQSMPIMMGTGVPHWVCGGFNGGLSKCDTYFGSKPGMGNGNAYQFLTNNSANNPAITWKFHATGETQSPGLLQGTNTIRLANDFTTANNTNLQTIFTWNLSANPNVGAQTWSFTCDLMYSQATANVAVAFGIQAGTNAPTNINATGTEQTNTTAFTGGSLNGLNSTAATSIVSATPGATGTVFTVHLGGTIENPTTTANAINIMVSTATGTDAVTVKRGSMCAFTP
jgi:hypothetical protein